MTPAENLLCFLFTFATFHGIFAYLPTTQPASDDGVSLCERHAMKRHKDKIVRLGVILPYYRNYPWRVQLTHPALELALDRIRGWPGLLDNYTLEFIFRDSDCSDTTAPLEAIDMYTKKLVDAFLGPACDYAVSSIAGFTVVWEIPVITAGALVSNFADKTGYRLLTRVQGNFDKATKSFAAIMRHLRYKNIGLFYDVMTECKFIMISFFDVIKSQLNPDMDNHMTEKIEGVSGIDASLKRLSGNSRGEIRDISF